MKQHIGKRLLSLLLVLVLVIGLFPVTARAADETSGTSGSLTWSYDGSGTLTFSGEGAMEDYSSSAKAPWLTASWAGDITKVVLEEGVTGIGAYAFYQLGGNLATIEVPSSLTSIGKYAFRECTGLTGTFPLTQKMSVGTYAFRGCTGLTGAVIPDGWTTIPNGLFYGCTGLMSVTLPDTLISIGNSVFYGCTGLTEMVLPESLTTIGVTAFRTCTGISHIALPASITAVGNSAFAGWTSSQVISVAIPEPVAKLKWGTAWYGDATVEYAPLDISWCDGVELCVTDGETIYSVTFDRENLIATLRTSTDYAVFSTSGNLTLTAPAASATKDGEAWDGTVTMPDSVSFVYNSTDNNYAASDVYLTLTKGDDTIDVGLRYLPAGYFVSNNFYLYNNNSLVGGYAQSKLVEDGSLDAVVNAAACGNLMLRLYVAPDATVTADCGTVAIYSSSTTSVTYNISGIDAAEHPSVTITITNAIGEQRDYLVRFTRQYNVNLTAGEGGQLTASTAAAAEGAVVTLVSDPDEGKKAAGWTVTCGTEAVEVTPDPEDPNQATFIMPAGEVSAAVTFRDLEDGEASVSYRIKSFTVEYGTAVIDESTKTIAVKIGLEGDLTQVTPTITVSDGAAVSPATGETVDLSSAKTYTVTRDGHSRTYRVTGEKQYFQGSGTAEDPYRISTAADLRALSQIVTTGAYKTSCYLQTADIDLAGKNWTPISSTFAGTYDGGGHKISNLICDLQTTEKVGLFAGLAKGAVIRDLTLDETCSIKGRYHVGGFAGYVTGAQLINCVNYAEVYAAVNSTGSTGARACAGGIVGESNTETAYTGCYNYGCISGNPEAKGYMFVGAQYVGGIAGIGYGTFLDCHNYGDVLGGYQVGGITSSAYNTSLVACSNSGTITSQYSSSSSQITMAGTGGLVGSLDATSVMEGCYNTGAVIADWTGVGGLVGEMKGTVYNCYNAGTVTCTYEGKWEVRAGTIAAAYTTSADSDALYAQSGSGLPAFGYLEKMSESVTEKSAEELRSAEFLAALQNYTTKLLSYTQWAQDTENVNDGYPIIRGFAVKKNYEKDLLTAKVGDWTPVIDQETQTITLVLPYGTDLTNLALTMTLSNQATVSPASGEAVDFSGGPVTYTVTAEDGSTKAYTVSLTAAVSPNGFAMLNIGTYTGELLNWKDFRQNQLTYDIHLDDSDFINGKSGPSVIYCFAFKAQLAEESAAITGTFNGGTEGTLTPKGIGTVVYLASNAGKYGATLQAGLNVLTLTVTPEEGEATTYTFNIYVTPHLYSLSFTAGDETLVMDKTFAEKETEYTVTVPNGVTEITPVLTQKLITDVPTAFSKTLNEDGSLDISDIDSFTITVGEDDCATVYTIHLEKLTGYTARFDVTPADAVVALTNTDTKSVVLPDEDGLYSLDSGITYTYVITAKGYVTATGAITGPEDLTSGALTVALEQAAEADYTVYDAEWPNFRGSDANMAVTASPTAASANDVELLWTSLAGEGYSSGAVGSPIIVGDFLYAYSGTSLLKIDRETGNVVATGTMVGASDFAIIPPTYAEGMIFVGLSAGRVQAFRADTLESLWVYQDPLQGQSNSPITYSDGCVYTGFWNGETKSANFVCLSVTDEDPTSATEAKYAMWSYTQLGGFYWAGAYASDGYVVVGTDDGQSGYTDTTANLLVFNKNDGTLVSSKTGYTGDIRSNIAYDESSDRVYFTSKGGYFYSEKIDWTTGAIAEGESKAIALGGMSTSTPVIYKGRAYVGVSGTGQFTAYSGHNITVLDLTSWSVAYTAQTMGYPQTSGLLTTAYESEDGYVYVYFTDNYTPGMIRYIKDKAGVTSVVGGVTEDGHTNCAPVLFAPADALAQYCICSPVADRYGTIYFKNDTGYMMALTSRITGIEVETAPTSAVRNEDGSWSVEGAKIVARLANGLTRDVTPYVTYASAENDPEEPVASYTYGFDSVSYSLTTFTASLGEGSAPAEETDYSVALSGSANIHPGETAQVSMTVSSTMDERYNAYYYKLTYDPEVLTYTSVSGDETVRDKNGVLTVLGYGADRALDEAVILTFTGKAPGEGKVTLIQANIDKAANANAQDAPEAAITVDTATITVGGYTVTLSEDFTGESNAAAGADYTFTAKDLHYDYVIGATMGGEPVEVVDNGNGTYTIQNVTGNLVIMDTKTPKCYQVTVEGAGAGDVTAETTAAYLTDYSFTLNKAAGYTYGVTVAVGGESFQPTLSEDGGTYTIPGASVTGEIVIQVAKEAIPVTTTEITFTGEGSGDVVGGTTQTANNGQDFTFTLERDESYDYVVRVDGSELEPNENGSYTIPGSRINGTAITVTIEKTAKQSLTVEVGEYVKLDGKTMWLITASGSVGEGKVLAYDGSAMFWSEKYGAYAWLVISDRPMEEIRAEAEGKVAESAAAKTEIVYDGDVNETALVDVNDAQLVYDMYNAKYESFEAVSMQKFLKADVNGSGNLNVEDAVAIVSQIA